MLWHSWCRTFISTTLSWYGRVSSLWSPTFLIPFSREFLKNPSFYNVDTSRISWPLSRIQTTWNVDKQKRSKQRKIRKRKAGGGRKLGLESMADRLLFILSYLKLYPIQELHAFLFGLSQSQANRLIHRSATVLKQALGAKEQLPEREGEQLEAAIRACESLTCTQDGSERRRQRPKKGQKEYDPCQEWKKQ